MAKKQTINRLLPLIILVSATVIILPALLLAAKTKTPNPDSLAAEVAKVITCPQGTGPTLRCPEIPPTPTGAPANRDILKQWQQRWQNFRSQCFWECAPLPTRPSRPTRSPLPTTTYPRPTRPLPTSCPDINCPLNCVQVLNPSGCKSCNCNVRY